MRLNLLTMILNVKLLLQLFKARSTFLNTR